MILPPDFELSLARLLLKATPHFERAYVGGGCLRDTLLRKPIKDIDVFIHVESMTPKEVGIKLMSVFDTNVGIMAARAEDGTAYFGDEIVGVYDCGRCGEFPVQVVALDHAMMEKFGCHPVERFDFGLCQLAYIDGTLVATEAFRKDAEDKTFTVMMAADDWRAGRALARFERLTEKFPDYRLIMPSTNDIPFDDLAVPPLGNH